MRSTRSRLTSCFAVVGALLIGAGCQGSLPEEELTTEQDVQLTSQALEGEEPRKVEDLIGGLDPEESVLHVEEQSGDVVLEQLQAVRIGDGLYEATDELTGEVSRFQIKFYPWDQWLRLWKYCPATNEWILSWRPCPTKIVSNIFIRVWKNSSCSRLVQTAGWGSCTGYGLGYSTRTYNLEAWKCGVGTGYCVERPAAKTLRFNYSQPGCGQSMLLNISTISNDYLCKSKAPLLCQ
jgi:hypothetical protein